MKKVSTKKVVVCLLVTIITIILLQGFSFTKSENIQMIKKSENEYMIYVSGLLNENFEFAFSNDSEIDKSTLIFNDSALDQLENGNHIAYVDSDIYTQYFEGKAHTFLWVKQEENYKVEAEEVKLENALSEETIQMINNATKEIAVEIKEKDLPEETIDGVKVTRRVGTINIVDNQEETYSYQRVKVTEGSDVAKLVDLVKKINELDDKDMYEKLSTYNEFKEVYSNLAPDMDDEEWKTVDNYTIEQPQDSQDGEQYMVWIKDSSKIDFQIMTCKVAYTPVHETQNVTIKETTKLPITGESIAIFVILGIVLLLIVVVMALKLKNKKEEKK